MTTTMMMLMMRELCSCVSSRCGWRLRQAQHANHSYAHMICRKIKKHTSPNDDTKHFISENCASMLTEMDGGRMGPRPTATATHHHHNDTSPK